MTRPQPARHVAAHTAWAAWFDASPAREIAARGCLSGTAIGGALLDVGMILARGCSSRLLVLAAQGHLRPAPSGRILAFKAQAARCLRALLVALCSLGVNTLARAEPALPLQRVSDTVWFVQGAAALGSSANRNFISNAGFVVTPQGVVVIDALGSPALAEELIEAIRQVTAQPIRFVIVTHYHADHVYGLQAFKALGATIIANRAGLAYLNSDTARLRLAASRDELFPWIDEHTHLVPADRWLDADTQLELGSEIFHIRHVGPAHTPEDLVVLAEHAGVMFAGDLVFRGRIPYVGQADSGQWIASLGQLIKLGPRTVVPGHGPISTDPLADLQMTRDYLIHLRQTMAEAAANLEPFEEAYVKADWSRFEHMPLFRAANRMNAYNTYLLLEHQGAAAENAAQPGVRPGGASICEC